MLVTKVLPLVQSLGQRRWSDEEIKEDLDWIEGELKENFEGLTCVSSFFLSPLPLLTGDGGIGHCPRLNEAELYRARSMLIR